MTSYRFSVVIERDEERVTLRFARSSRGVTLRATPTRRFWRILKTPFTFM